MKDFFGVIKARHSYRGAFLPTAVGREALEKIVEAGRMAPSACNKQSPRFIVIDEEKVMAEVRKIVGGVTVQTAQAFILIVFDPTPQYGSVSFGAEDCGAVATNMLNAVTALGLASVWLDGVLRGDAGKALDRLLDIPAPFSARILLPLGVPETPGNQPERKPVEERVGWNAFTATMR